MDSPCPFSVELKTISSVVYVRPGGVGISRTLTILCILSRSCVSYGKTVAIVSKTVISRNRACNMPGMRSA